MTPSDDTRQDSSGDAAYWARPVSKLSVSGVTEGVADLVEGRQLMGPLQGFGKMWQKTYRIRLGGAAVVPAEVISRWKQEFPRFWPRGNHFYAPLAGIRPGEVALVSVDAGPVRLSTGVMVLYADPESFTLMTPEGHMFAGWITFSSFEEEGCCVAQAQILMRAQDPISEVGLALGGHRQEDRFWQHTLRALAATWHIEAEAETQVVCVDPRRRWSHAKNVWHNAAIRSQLHMLTAPIRWLGRPLRRRRRSQEE
jgi:hypothetical protein